MSLSKYENGLERATPVKRSEVQWCPKRKEKVLAIDFGTSTLAVSYKADGKIIDVILQQASRDAYIPTVLLVKPDNTVEIGEIALLQYTRLQSYSIFFDRVKLELQHDQEVGRRTSVTASNGRSYYLLEVIALILKRVREILKKHFEVTKQHDIKDFHWVLTIPALWGKKARDMMREAAYLAGLCSDQSTLQLPLKPTYTHYPEPVKEKETNPECLSLVYEPDAAAAWCRELTPEKVQTNPDARPPLTTDDFFLTVDIGGGTIDVTGHQILKNGRMKRVNLPHGEIYGGTIVNEAFKVFLAKEIVHDVNFSSYLLGSDNKENRAELLGLIYVEFEKTKKLFTAESKDAKYNVLLPPSFVETYAAQLRSLQKASISSGACAAYVRRTQYLEISNKKMSSFFEPNIKKVHECINRAKDDIIQNHGDKLKIIYLVGGFGGCHYIGMNIRATYGSDSTKVLIPANPELAIVRGACEYHEKNIVEEADATYGIETCIEFDVNNPVHCNGHKIVADNGTEFCEKLFQPFVHIRDKLEQGFIYTGSYLPLRKGQNNVTFVLYSTDEEYVNYTYGRDGNCLIPSATITIENKSKEQKKVEFVLDFSSTEIQVYARFEHSGERVKASVDFLSTLNKFEEM